MQSLLVSAVVASLCFFFFLVIMTNKMTIALRYVTVAVTDHHRVCGA